VLSRLEAAQYSPPRSSLPSLSRIRLAELDDMPLQPHGRNFAANSADRESQVATSNETVNVLFGGAQRSWMSNVPSVQPTPRPKNPRKSPRKAQQPPPVPLQYVLRSDRPHTSSLRIHDATLSLLRASSDGTAAGFGDNDMSNSHIRSAPSVLPSPAPSDEPSPAVSATVDSPNPISASLPGPQSMGEPVFSTANANQLRLPVTEARFAVCASPEALTRAAATAVNQNNRQGSDGYIGQSAECSVSGSSATPSTNTQAPTTTFLQPGSAGQPTPSAQSSYNGKHVQAIAEMLKGIDSPAHIRRATPSSGGPVSTAPASPLQLDVGSAAPTPNLTMEPNSPARDAQSSTPESARQASSQIAKDTGRHTPTVIQQSGVSHQNPPPILSSVEAQSVVTDASSRALHGMRIRGTAASSPSTIIPSPTLSQPQHQNTGPPAKRQRIDNAA
jgi:hypothetical protein